MNVDPNDERGPQRQTWTPTTNVDPNDERVPQRQTWTPPPNDERVPQRQTCTPTTNVYPNDKRVPQRQTCTPTTNVYPNDERVPQRRTCTPTTNVDPNDERGPSTPSDQAASPTLAEEQDASRDRLLSPGARVITARRGFDPVKKRVTIPVVVYEPRSLFGLTSSLTVNSRNVNKCFLRLAASEHSLLLKETLERNSVFGFTNEKESEGDIP
ncbi:uncharacterized protein [Procambarus clarkii]|uniref:uncharacterized protein n=1 Tax=Procambarus clarkii TaxID=6728 RepID=UPI0037429051